MRADERFRSIPGIVGVVAATEGDCPAIVDGKVRCSFAEVERAMVQSCRAAIAFGIQPGDRVAIWAPNMFEWIVAALGALGAGAVLVPINTRYKGLEAAHVIDRSGATMLFTVGGFLGLDFTAMLRDVVPDSPVLRRCVTLRGDGSFTFDEFLAGGDGVDEDEAYSRIAAIEPEDVSDIMFTSGTTGAPKGVMLDHGQSLRGFEAFNDGFGLRRGDRMAVVAPFFHCFGYKAGWMLCLMTGATCYPLAVFDARSMVELIEKERVSVIAGAPTMMADILNLLSTEAHDVSSLRYAFTSAATVPYELIVRMRNELPVEAVGTGYGLTEATAIVSVTSYDDGPEVIAGTSGKAIPGTDVKTVDADGDETERGEAGELLVRGFNVMRGYWQDPEATAATIDEDGWLHTGDVATIDESGNIKITDRLKDMFIVGGFNTYPAEIEALLLRDQRIAQVAVIGVPDERLGEVGAAFVIPRPGVQLTADDVRDWARAHLANFKVPHRVEIVDALPLNATGKVLKHELRARVTATAN
jgi:acyl-CoA synthetase (AMP-forming)/AMP-acid ligase II